MDGEFVIFSGYGDGIWHMMVRTLDGREIVAPELEMTISAVTDEGGAAIAFLMNTNHPGMYFGQQRSGYHPNTYRLVDTDGTTIAAGRGIITHHKQEALYSVLGPDYFAWLDMGGNVVISIPHLSGTMD